MDGTLQRQASSKDIEQIPGVLYEFYEFLSREKAEQTAAVYFGIVKRLFETEGFSPEYGGPGLR